MSALAGDDYLAFCEGLREICGIDLTQYKRPQMERRLRSFFACKGFERLTDGLKELRSNGEELDALLDRVTINVSQLWRNPAQWDQLGHDVLPELGERGRIRAWSAGCSYGAEAYTLAATCRSAIPATPVRIVGTDIDRRMVVRARTGEFSLDDARTAPAGALRRWFEPTDNGWRARPELGAMTRFEVGDLLRMDPGAAAYDLILCRNTVIYFAQQIRDRLHARLARALRPGGWLVVGATERVFVPGALGLEPIHPFMLRKS
jgi:chemotaxis protein methyltransferase CheR